MEWLTMVCSYTKIEPAHYGTQWYHRNSHTWPQEFSYEVRVEKEDQCFAMGHKMDSKKMWGGKFR